MRVMSRFDTLLSNIPSIPKKKKKKKIEIEIEN